jgi:hypothetical protein
MGAKSKIKGSNGERELCKLLTEIFSGNFARVPNSGAMVGGKNIHRRQVLSKVQDRAFRGDIIPPDHLPRLVIEAKSYKDFRFHQLLQPGPCLVLDKWIKQTIDVTDPGDQWFVAFKISMRGWYVAIPEDACGAYVFENHCLYSGVHGRMRVTDLLGFFRANHTLVAERAGPLKTNV